MQYVSYLLFYWLVSVQFYGILSLINAIALIVRFGLLLVELEMQKINMLVRLYPFNWWDCKCGLLFHDSIAKSNYRNHTFELCVDNVIVCQLFYLSRICIYKKRNSRRYQCARKWSICFGLVWGNATNVLIENLCCFIFYRYDQMRFEFKHSHSTESELADVETWIQTQWIRTNI